MGGGSGGGGLCVCVVCVCWEGGGVCFWKKKTVNAEIIKGNVWYSQERLEHQ